VYSGLSYAYAALVVAGLGYFLYDLPIQITDSYGNLVKASQTTLGPLVYSEFHQHGYLRPLLWGQLRFVYDLSGGSYYEWFRGWHVGQVALLALLFLRLLRPGSWSGAAVVPLGLAALIGSHTFTGTIVEAFPINTFMTILLCCFAAADLATGPPRWWRDVAAAMLFVFAALTVESGLLVGVIFVVAYLAGARGLSRAGVGLQCLLVAGYFVLRFSVLDVGSPGLTERPSGYGFSRLEPAELAALFQDNPLPFYAYNVLSSILSILFAEPRWGTWGVTRGILQGSPSFAALVSVIASTIGTYFIAAYVWRRRREWLARRCDRSDQLVIIFVAVTAANAILSYAYTKDVILSPAGALFAVALAIAVRHRIDMLAQAPITQIAATGLILIILTGAWSFRAIVAHLELRAAAAATRADWVYVDEWLERASEVPTEPSAIELKRVLQDEAIRQHPLRPRLAGTWLRWFDDE
jgi:hypothetical protein